MSESSNPPQQPSTVDDLYLQQLVSDVKAAESQLRGYIDYRGMSFSQSRLDDSRANVDRIHKLVRTYLAKERLNEPE